MTGAPFKLRTRIGFYFLGLVSTWTLFVLLLLGNLLSDKAREHSRDLGSQIARGLAIEVGPLVRYEDIPALSEVLENRMATLTDIRYIIVLGEDGEIVWSSFPGGVPEPLLHIPHDTETGPGVKVQLVNSDREQIYDYAARAPGVEVRLGLSLTSVQVFAQEVTSYVLWIGMAALLTVLGVTLRVSRPVEALAAAVSRIGNVETAGAGLSDLGGTFETAALADWFDAMALQLEESSRRLDKSKKLAYLGEIAASIAHEINNPLGIIVLNSGFLADRVAANELQPNCAREVSRVRAAAMRATLAAQKLLQFARYSTQGGGIQLRPCRPELLIQETIDLLRDRIRVADCTVDVAIEPSKDAVMLDPQGIQQVLFNLITNALDASEPGGRLAIRTAVTDEELIMSVADEGCGMSEELLETAREPFVTTKAAGKGTGLGLAISDSIVEGHGGTIEFASEPGEGTVVTVKLPLKRRASSPPPPKDPA